MKLIEIGRVENQFNEPVDPFKIKECESRIIIHSEFTEGLHRIDDSDYLIIFYGFHRTGEFVLSQKTCSGNIKGIFATRSPRRPSPLGMTTVKLISVKENVLIVKGLDAINNTPVYDIKPFALIFDHNEILAINNKEKKEFPRRDLQRFIKSGYLLQCLLKAGELHGHFCPGLTLGVMATVYGLQQFGYVFGNGMDQLVSIIEINNCFADGVQMISGCTIGNNRLIYRDFGKIAVTFILKNKKAVRVWAQPGYLNIIHTQFPEFSHIFNRVIKEQKRDTEGIKDWEAIAQKASFFLITQSPDTIFNLSEVNPDYIEYAPIHETVMCSVCNEPIIASKISNNSEEATCISCGKNSFFQLDGSGICKIE